MSFPESYNPSNQAQTLQQCVVATVDLALNLKQLHWNIQGPHFKPVHEFLDDIIDHARTASDQLAERIATLGIPAVGQRASLGDSPLPNIENGFLKDKTVLTQTDTMLVNTITVLRNAQESLGKLDAVSEDLVIGHLAEFEKDLWMIRSHLA